MPTTTTDGQLYIVELLPPYDRVAIQYVPEGLAMTRRANVQKIDIVARNNPLYQYTGGEETLAVRLDFHANDEDKSEVIKKTRWLQSLAQNDAGRGPQPLVQLIWGDLFKRSKWVIESVDVQLSMFYAEAGFLPGQAYVNLAMKLYTYANVPKSDFRDRKYGR